ncbi:MAG: NAD(P)/FAD-dependent oxidoreductase [Halioglobus sp.]
MSRLKRRELLQRGAALSAAAMLGPIGSASAVGIDYDVIIIGAGISGMSAARMMSKVGPGLKVLVLDARDRVGGRIYTSTDDVSPHGVELGAQFIHGSKAATFELVEEYGLQTRSMNHFGEPEYLYFNEGQQAAPLNEDAREASYTKLQQAYAAYEGPDISLGEFTEKLGLDGPDPDTISTEANSWSAEPDRISMRAAVEDGAQWDEYLDENFIIFGGYSRLVKKMEAELSGRIRLESVVTDILWGEEFCGVIYKDRGIESAVTARRVIVTVPVGVLHSGDLKFQPPLPKAKQSALNTIEMGQAVVVPMLFEKAFWQGVIPSPGGLSRMDGRVHFSVPHDVRPEGNAISGWFTGSAAQQLSALGPEAGLQLVLQWLEQASGFTDLQQQLTWHAFKDWQTDPYSYGSYSITRPGGQGQRAELAKPVANTLFFAGEATQPAPHYQTVHGAYLSGLRVVDEVASSLDLKVGEEGVIIELL